MKDTLDKLFLKHKTDKSSLIHDYSDSYSTFLNEIKSKNLKVLEIGIGEGNSLKVWYEYFTNSKIVGIDLYDYMKRHENDRVHVEIGNQEDENFLEKVSKKYGGFDVIIDDGGHTWKQQKSTFKTLFKELNNGGFYYIEDVHPSYMKFSCNENETENTVDFFKKLIDDINLNGKSLNGITDVELSILGYYERWIELMCFYTGIIVVKKRSG